MELEIGQLVRSKAGRDRGRYYLVWGQVGDNFIRVVDGEVRRLDNPKLKNVKHVQVAGKVADEIVQKVQRGQPVTNAQIRKAIAMLIEPQNERG